MIEQRTQLTNEKERERIRDIVAKNIGNLAQDDLAVLGYYEWLEGLERGIAVHHAGLLPAFKTTVEDLFQEGLVS